MRYAQGGGLTDERRAFRVESGKAPLESFVPQNHQPGHEAEFPRRIEHAYSAFALIAN